MMKMRRAVAFFFFPEDRRTVAGAQVVERSKGLLKKIIIKVIKLSVVFLHCLLDEAK